MASDGVMAEPTSVTVEYRRSISDGNFGNETLSVALALDVAMPEAITDSLDALNAYEESISHLIDLARSQVYGRLAASGNPVIARIARSERRAHVEHPGNAEG